jgi:hypothetical protein
MGLGEITFVVPHFQDSSLMIEKCLIANLLFEVGKELLA